MKVAIFTLLAFSGVVNADFTADANALLANQKTVRLDPILRKALLKALTELEEEAQEKARNEEEEARSAATNGDHITQSLQNSNSDVNSQDETSYQAIKSEIQNTADSSYPTPNPLSVQETVSPASDDFTTTVVPDDTTQPEVNTALPVTIKNTFFFQTPTPLEGDKTKIQKASEFDIETNLISDDKDVKEVRKETVTPRPVLTQSTVKVSSDNDVDIFKAPLVAAFTLHQDSRGTPHSIIPIYKQASHNLRQQQQSGQQQVQQQPQSNQQQFHQQSQSNLQQQQQQSQPNPQSFQQQPVQFQQNQQSLFQQQTQFQQNSQQFQQPQFLQNSQNFQQLFQQPQQVQQFQQQPQQVQQFQQPQQVQQFQQPQVQQFQQSPQNFQQFSFQQQNQGNFGFEQQFTNQIRLPVNQFSLQQIPAQSQFSQSFQPSVGPFGGNQNTAQQPLAAQFDINQGQQQLPTLQPAVAFHQAQQTVLSTGAVPPQQQPPVNAIASFSSSTAFPPITSNSIVPSPNFASSTSSPLDIITSTSRPVVITSSTPQTTFTIPAVTLPLQNEQRFQSPIVVQQPSEQTRNQNQEEQIRQRQQLAEQNRLRQLDDQARFRQLENLNRQRELEEERLRSLAGQGPEQFRAQRQQPPNLTFQRSVGFAFSPNQYQQFQPTQHRVNRQEGFGTTANFGFNGQAYRTIPDEIYRQQVYRSSPQQQLAQLLFQSGVGVGPVQEDLNIVSKVLALNHERSDAGIDEKNRQPTSSKLSQPINVPTLSSGFKPISRSDAETESQRSERSIEEKTLLVGEIKDYSGGR